MKQVTLASETIPFVAVTIRLPVELHQRLVEEAKRRSTPIRKVSMVEVMREAIDKAC